MLKRIGHPGIVIALALALPLFASASPGPSAQASGAQSSDFTSACEADPAPGPIDSWAARSTASPPPPAPPAGAQPELPRRLAEVASGLVALTLLRWRRAR
jgi:hypothetical protein